MLRPPTPNAPSETDRHIFDCLVSPDHYVRRASEAIDFQQFRPLLVPCYSPDMGRPADDPVLLLKLEFLQFHDNLSDRQVIERARTDVAYRFFLGLRLQDDLPDPSLLSYFRGRLSTDGHEKIFQQVVTQARTAGLVKDRLRLKDATHVIADVAIPTTLVLLAQTRDRLLAAAGAFDAVRVEGERARVEMLRSTQATGSDEERLAARVAHLREILGWVDELAQPADGDGPPWQALQDACRLAHKILSDQDPKAGDRTRSVVDPDARRSKHGEWFDGYLLDVMMDADSELITAVNVLPGNGAEGADALELVRQEEAAQGNDIERLSIDGAGFQGQLLRELEDTQGVAIDAYVPPKAEPATGLFGPADFVAKATGEAVTCPAGQTSHYRQRDEQDHSTIYRFRRETCATCPLLVRCMSKPPSGLFGRTVRKNDYEAEYQRARQKATTEAYAAVRAEHPKIERKLSELVRRHGARRARYRGLVKMLCQALMMAVVTNVKRIVRLLCARKAAPAHS